ncbi:hypothetical protein L484_021476 [Morus notabilis]|uniref:Uncharacterized protein n=1 Tax=Morus notabilis TaxID=981085 RepID=W9T0B1_9ROSA|nr:hypothetical protein L484_021476 [Morus notabilis]
MKPMNSFSHPGIYVGDKPTTIVRKPKNHIDDEANIPKQQRHQAPTQHIYASIANGPRSSTTDHT